MRIWDLDNDYMKTWYNAVNAATLIEVSPQANYFAFNDEENVIKVYQIPDLYDEKQFK